MPRKAKGVVDVRSLARAHTETAIKVLAGIMNEKTAAPAARAAAADSLLARGWGRPKQELDVNHGAQDSLKDLMASIDGRSRGLPNAE